MKNIRPRKVYVMIDRENYPENIKVTVFEHEVPILRKIHGEQNVRVVHEVVKKIHKKTGNLERIIPAQMDFEEEMDRVRIKYGGKCEHIARAFYKPAKSAESVEAEN